MKEFGFYIIDDKFFTNFNDSYLKGNKKENRPHYCCIKDKTDDRLFWVIPLSSRVEKYRAIINKRIQNNKRCDILHIIKIANTENVFLIQDMFPITDKYIKREYTICGKPLVLINENDRTIIKDKSYRILNMIERKIRFLPTQVDALKIKNKLISELNYAEYKI